jgi:hypothetical protein
LCTTDDDCNIGEVCVPDNGGTKCMDAFHQDPTDFGGSMATSGAFTMGTGR